ncbi:glycosyltransferase [Variovorax sp. PBL-E5]|uniref:glycosyltransferase n=1 Tax=Variovorax sp. PBL-E5 TaxID=434014 RepID=UPI00131933C9|nr:glycosyltransferase [Variovorax sp. PBL-E5]VTU19035.1 Glycosyl transferases group 1 [Variovorax sp. PBL-E5]
MARIAYVDHSFHQTTLSTAFLPDLLTRHGHAVDHFWDEAWRGGAPVRFADVASHDAVIMFQSYCPPEGRYFRHRHPNVVYVPMLDQFGFWNGPHHDFSGFWEPFQGSKVLNFSNAAHCMTQAFGIASHFVRYYQPARERPPPPAEGLHGFFWVRRELELPWRSIRKLIENEAFDSFHVHLATDPGTPPPEPPTAEDIAKHHITLSTWFDDKADLEAVLDRANVFFAPRPEEGIGQSFLEAMGRGQCVVAPNQGTMNEYIVPGLNGLLYDVHDPRPLDFSAAAELGARGRDSAATGRARWEAAEAELVRFLLTPSEALYHGKYQHSFAGVAARQAVQTPAVGGLRGAAQRYAVFRCTRFIWHPMVRWMRQLSGH